MKSAALLIPTAISLCFPASAGEGQEESGTSVSVDLEVTGLGDGPVSVPVTVPVDLTAWTSELGIEGAVDERSIRLFRWWPVEGDPEGTFEEEIFQLTPATQPHPGERRLRKENEGRVSYIGEHPCGEAPRGLRVAGELTWWVEGYPTEGVHRYRLDFGVPAEGLDVQVPYEPRNLRHFDPDGRAEPPRWFPRMQIRPQWPLDGKLRVLDGRTTIAEVHLGPAAAEGLPGSPAPIRRPFVYPLVGPDGISLTEVGKPHDPTGSHAHHYSFWIAHAKVQGRDFWSERGGTILHEGLERLEDGPVFCRLGQRARWVHDGTVLLRDRRTFTFHADRERLFLPEPWEHWREPFRLVDVELELSPPGDEPVELGQTTFGFLSARVAQSMTVFDGGGEILNSRGDRNEQGAHLKAARWIDQSGPVAPGVWNGIALLDHPENPHHPPVFHCRNDGWACASFNGAAPYRIEPGATLRLRYRVVLHRSGATNARIDARWREYAAEPRVRWGPPRRTP